MDEGISDWRIAPVLLVILVFALFMVVLYLPIRQYDLWLKEAEQEVVATERKLTIANRQITELEGHLRVCETTIAWEDSCCAIQSRCLERNAILEKRVSDCSTASPTWSGDSERPPASYSPQ